MTQPPPPAPGTPPPAGPPKTQEEAMKAWEEEQGYQKFATWMSRWITEQSAANTPPPPKTDKPRSGGLFDGLFGS